MRKSSEWLFLITFLLFVVIDASIQLANGGHSIQSILTSSAMVRQMILRGTTLLVAWILFRFAGR